MFGAIIGGLFSVVGGWIGGLFKRDASTADMIGKAAEAIQDVNKTSSEKTRALADVIIAENNSGGLAGLWRPMFMCIFMIIILSFWFGYVPPQLTTPMPPMIARLFDLIEMGLMGYIPCRTLEKIVTQLNLGSTLKVLIDRYITK